MSNAGPKVAVFIKKLDGWSGDARLYQLAPPLADYDGVLHEFVVVSATVVNFGVSAGPETYLFGATAEGSVPRMIELPGSLKGTLSHDEALRNAGYKWAATVVPK